MFKYKEKTAFTYNTHGVYATECSPLQKIKHKAKYGRQRWPNSSTLHTVFKQAIVNTNWVLYYCCSFSTWTTRKMHDFQGYFSRTLQDPTL